VSSTWRYRLTFLNYAMLWLFSMEKIQRNSSANKHIVPTNDPLLIPTEQSLENNYYSSHFTNNAVPAPKTQWNPTVSAYSSHKQTIRNLSLLNEGLKHSYDQKNFSYWMIHMHCNSFSIACCQSERFTIWTLLWNTEKKSLIIQQQQYHSD